VAEAGLFIGWGQVVRGREQRALEVWGESLQYWSQLESEGRIESFELVLLSPHGGDLNGFALLRGSGEQMSAVRSDEEFQRRVQRADLIVESQGVVDAVLGDGLQRVIEVYQDEAGQLG
jgi:hypothetical protein